nr:hypothetical protein [Tanacetum cinerariifolium]
VIGWCVPNTPSHGADPSTHVIIRGLRIPKVEWRGKDTSRAHLKVFDCDLFVKVKDVCGEAMKCTFTGNDSDEMRYSFQDTESHQVGAQIRVRGPKIVRASRIVEDQMKNTLKTEHLTRMKASRLHMYEDPPESPGLQISAGKNASQRLWMFKVKEEQDGNKSWAKLVRILISKRVLIFVKDSWNKEPCNDVHQVSDEREVEVIRNLNWPSRELIIEDVVLPERGSSLMMLV